MPPILLISPEPWDAHAVSKHHYASSLAAQGYRVLFLDPPELGRRGVVLEDVGGCPGLQRVRAGKVAHGLRWLPGPLRRWFERRWLYQLEQQAGCPIAVIWLFENSRFFDLRFAGPRLKIYHQVDLNQSFHPETAARTADICFCTSELIRQRLLPHNPRCYRLQHGVAILKAPIPLKPTEQQRFHPGQIQAMYVGNLDISYLDRELLATVVASHPEIFFHLVGGYSTDAPLFHRLRKAPNVVWWGHVESAKLPGLLSRSDLLILCYSQAHRDQVSNPHKLMQYLASGRTVVATFTDEFLCHRDLLAMSEPGSNAGYPELFASVLANIDSWNAQARVEARRAFAADHSYERQLERIQAHLQQHGLSLPAVPS